MNRDRIAVALIGLMAIGAISDKVFGNITVTTITVDEYTRHRSIPIGSAIIGGGAPGATTVGTYNGLSLDDNTEILFFNFHVPMAWTGTSDMALVWHWVNQAGTLIPENDAVKFNCDYRSRADGEVLDSGNATSTTITFTQTGGAGTDKENHETAMPIDFDQVDNPISVGDIIGFSCLRGKDAGADTYAGDATVYHWGMTYQSTGIGSD